MIRSVDGLGSPTNPSEPTNVVKLPDNSTHVSIREEYREGLFGPWSANSSGFHCIPAKSYVQVGEMWIKLTQDFCQPTYAFHDNQGGALDVLGPPALVAGGIALGMRWLPETEGDELFLNQQQDQKASGGNATARGGDAKAVSETRRPSHHPSRWDGKKNRRPLKSYRPRPHRK